MTYWPFPIYQGKKTNKREPIKTKRRKAGAHKEAVRAYLSYHAQKARCGNPKCAFYRLYGAKGVRVEYSASEFISWWMYHVALKPYKDPTCGRIDHSGNYRFGNIEIQERGDNTREALQRVGRPRNYIRGVMLVNEHGQDAIYFKSVKLAEDMLKIENVGRACRRNIRTGGFRFRYHDGGAPSLS